ncbi:hypothetical protein A3Q56_01211 [Intoshia linei]|uniref:Innexin n=1 Tax=Intoshia linei TaxID=1819745 RepID=A0A177B9X7_9BILA|nr:hypothetical protein A3Q56_01211 [Intoshia linei]
MEALAANILDFGDGRIGGGDAITDRINCRYTTFLFIVFAILHIQYSNRVCWTKNTFYLAPNEDTPFLANDSVKIKHKRISYYQWVGLLLSLQSILFYLPRAIWNILNNRSGISVVTIIDAAIEAQRTNDPDKRSKTTQYIIRHMSRFFVELNRKHLLYTRFKGIWWMLYGMQLVSLYGLVKILYIINSIGQFFALNWFLGQTYTYYGVHCFLNMINGISWQTSERFPTVTLCQFTIREPGNDYEYMIQCTLPINLFIERIYLLIWFWLLLVSFINIASCLSLIFKNLLKSRLLKSINTRLIVSDILEGTKKEDCKKFVNDYLRRDGVFLIRMIASNTSELIASEM